MNDLTIETEIDFQEFETYKKLYEGLLDITQDFLKIKETISMGVTFISPDKAQELNKEYRDKDYIADVISFPIDDEFNMYEQLGFREIGDVFICVDKAKEKAEEYGHTFKEEMSWLFVHGLLHILGYDHETNEEDAKVMFELTDKILDKINVKYIMK